VIRYENSFTDLLWFAAHRNRHSPVVLTVYALLAGYAFYVGYISNPRARSLAHLVAAVGVSVAIVGLLVIVSAILIALAMASRENRTVLTEHTITLTDTGLLEETRFNRTEQKWAGVTRLARTRRHIFVYVSRDAAHVIPRRAFADAVACDAFYERLRAGVQRG
jgi:hypothetical protein